MDSTARKVFVKIAVATGIGLLAILFGCAYVLERLLRGLHIAAAACRSTLARRLPTRGARQTPEVAVGTDPAAREEPTILPDAPVATDPPVPADPPIELRDGLRPLPGTPMHDQRREAA